MSCDSAHIGPDTGRVRFSRTFVGESGSTASLRHLALCLGGTSGIDTDACMLERVLLRAISGPVPEAPPAAAISLSACAGRCRAGAWPSPGAGGGSDRFRRPGFDPQKSLVGPPRHVLPVLNGCVGTQARTQYKPRRSRTGTLPVYPLSPASMSASVGSTRISSPAARPAASPTTGSAAGR